MAKVANGKLEFTHRKCWRTGNFNYCRHRSIIELRWFQNGNYNQIGILSCWFISLFVAIKVTSANYPKLLLFFIIGVHFFITMFFIGADYDGSQLPYEQRIERAAGLIMSFIHFLQLLLAHWHF